MEKRKRKYREQVNKTKHTTEYTLHRMAYSVSGYATCSIRQARASSHSLHITRQSLSRLPRSFCPYELYHREAKRWSQAVTTGTDVEEHERIGTRRRAPLHPWPFTAPGGLGWELGTESFSGFRKGDNCAQTCPPAVPAFLSPPPAPIPHPAPARPRQCLAPLATGSGNT